MIRTQTYAARRARARAWARGAFGIALLMSAVAASGCGGSTGASGAGTTFGASGTDAPQEGGEDGASSDPGSSSKDSIQASDPSKPLVRPTGPLTRRDAQRYVLDLVNRDRKKAGLPPVAWDDTAAKAGQRHAEDMASKGFTGHIGSDGSTPELRHTDAGGSAMVMENAACFADALNRELDPDPRFTVDELERIERTFIEEVPPMDGHKRNILTAWHTSLGVGLAKTTGLEIVCMAQEFLDEYGEHAPLPKKAKVGDKITVSGAGREPATIGAVGVARVEKPKPAKAEVLLKTGVYAIPKPYVIYFPKGYKTPIPLQMTGSSYSIEIPLNDRGKPGIYEVSVWANVPTTKDLVMISLRTITVD
jgi:uncharacterized protein YkwD